MIEPALVRLRPHRSRDLISYGRTALATGLDGWVSSEDPVAGLWFCETRVLSRYAWRIDGSAPVSAVAQAFDRAREDLASLRLVDLDIDERAWVVAAGTPVYLTLFGRDSLIASWQAGLLSAEMMHGSLVQLARTQGSRDDPWRDEQPGRIVHEVHIGPVPSLELTPQGRYYGDVTSSLMYPFVVSMLWHWVGDEELVRPLVDPALRALEWADGSGDVDGDGFYEYCTLSEQGEKNQGWKDSSDAIVYPDGTQVPDPLGTCEMQGFAYVSKMLFAELLVWLGELGQARRLVKEAWRLKKRFNDAFWMEDEQFLALGLDAEKQQIRSIACDPGLCLASGIVDEALVPKIVARIMSPELFSGWGVRTLSARHPAYNPFAYHRGTIWPVANAIIALGFAREATATIRFRRRGTGPRAHTDYEVLSREGRLFVVRQPSPLSLFATVGERIRDFVTSFATRLASG